MNIRFKKTIFLFSSLWFILILLSIKLIINDDANYLFFIYSLIQFFEFIIIIMILLEFSLNFGTSWKIRAAHWIFSIFIFFIFIKSNLYSKMIEVMVYFLNELSHFLIINGISEESKIIQYFFLTITHIIQRLIILAVPLVLAIFSVYLLGKFGKTKIIN